MMKDRDLVVKLINDRMRYQPLFVRRYRERIFKIIEKTNEKIDPSSTIGIEQKKSILADFMDYLFNKDARVLNDFLEPKRLVVENNDLKKKYILVKSCEILGNVPIRDEENNLYLDAWVYKKACVFVRAKLLVSGIVVKNVNVINSFLLKTTPPSCQDLISNYVYSYHLDMKVIDVASILASTLYTSDSLIRKFNNYRYELGFYDYFEKYILKDFIEKLKETKKVLINPLYPRQKKGKDPSTDRVLREAIKELFSNERGDEKEANARLLEKAEILEKLPPLKVAENGILDSLDMSPVNNLGCPDNSSFDDHYHVLIKRIFAKMSNDARGKEMVEVLCLLLKDYKNKEIAETLGMSESSASKKKDAAMKMASRIARELGITLFSL